MKMFAIALLFVTASASADTAVVHFRDAIVVAECPQIDYAVFIEGSRHIGKIGASHGCKTTIFPGGGMVPDEPSDDFSTTAFIGNRLFFECVLLHVYRTDDINQVVAACDDYFILDSKEYKTR